MSALITALKLLLDTDRPNPTTMFSRYPPDDYVPANMIPALVAALMQRHQTDNFPTAIVGDRPAKDPSATCRRLRGTGLITSYWRADLDGPASLGVVRIHIAEEFLDSTSLTPGAIELAIQRVVEDMRLDGGVTAVRVTADPKSEVREIDGREHA